MSDIKKKIQEIKMARMGPEYRFVSEFFSDLEMKYAQGIKNKIFFLKDNKPVMLYMVNGKYLWCHNELLWNPLEKLISIKVLGSPQYLMTFKENVKKEMREIISHFGLAYFDLSDITPSFANSFVIESWNKHKFINKKPW